MKWFYDMKIGAKLIAAFILMASITAFIGYMGISDSANINAMLNDMHDNNLVPMDDIYQADIQAIYHNRALDQFILENEKSKKDA